ncbi:unnamed protein product [Larinioides sclopetarius]|uniref:Multiple coagulation factor deficiency protein 2 n=1 Tax=Larinioides sclopetarius TaxID=280406 RepID=A0AAV1ZH25_9ARAC
MYAMTGVIVIAFMAFLELACSHETTEHHQHTHHREPQMMTARSHVDERQHIGQHMAGEVDINQMAEDELRFLYFKMHDSDANNKLDGCELIKSLLHWHVEDCKSMGPDHEHHGTTRIFGSQELALMIDPILSSDDRNMDGFIDYPEFVAAQISRGF